MQSTYYVAGSDGSNKLMMAKFLTLENLEFCGRYEMGLDILFV